jgi:hypothetical protein
MHFHLCIHVIAHAHERMANVAHDFEAYIFARGFDLIQCLSRVEARESHVEG